MESGQRTMCTKLARPPKRDHDVWKHPNYGSYKSTSFFDVNIISTRPRPLLIIIDPTNPGGQYKVAIDFELVFSRIQDPGKTSTIQIYVASSFPAPG